MIFDEVARAAQYRKNSRFYQTVLEETLDSHMHKKKKWSSTYTSYLLWYAAKSLQSCPTLRPHDGSPPGPAIPGILQARTLEWVAISFSNAWKWKVKVKSLSRVRLFATPWTLAHQAPPSMGFSRQEYWSGVPLPSLILYDIINSKWIKDRNIE